MADIALGITLPIKLGKTGYFEQAFDTITQVKSNLINLLLTVKDECFNLRLVRTYTV